MQQLDGVQLHSFSSQTMVESLYRRAEVQSAGEGNRFLALLYNDASKSSAALASDPAFANFRKYSSEDLKRPFRFAPAAAIENVTSRPRLPDSVERAIGLLSEVYSG